MSMLKIRSGAGSIASFTIPCPPARSGVNRKVFVIQLAEGATVGFSAPQLDGVTGTSTLNSSGSSFNAQVHFWDEANISSSGGDLTVSNCGTSLGTINGDVAAAALVFENIASGGSPDIGTNSWSAGTASVTANTSASRMRVFYGIEPDNGTITLFSGSASTAQLLTSQNDGGQTGFAIGVVTNPDTTGTKTYGLTRSITTNVTAMGFFGYNEDTSVASGERVARPLAGKAGTAAGGKAIRVNRARPIVTKAATASSATASLTSTPAAPTGNLVTTGRLLMHL